MPKVYQSEPGYFGYRSKGGIKGALKWAARRGLMVKAEVVFRELKGGSPRRRNERAMQLWGNTSDPDNLLEDMEDLFDGNAGRFLENEAALVLERMGGGHARGVQQVRLQFVPRSGEE